MKKLMGTMTGVAPWRGMDCIDMKGNGIECFSSMVHAFDDVNVFEMTKQRIREARMWWTGGVKPVRTVTYLRMPEDMLFVREDERRKLMGGMCWVVTVLVFRDAEAARVFDGLAVTEVEYEVERSWEGRV